MEQSTPVKRLYRSRKNRVLAGVCGGLGEYLNIDPVVVRLIWVAISLVWGFGIILYIIAALIIPEEPTAASLTPTSTSGSQPPPITSSDSSKNLVAILGIIALVAGFMGLTLTITAALITSNLVSISTIPIYLIRLLRLSQIMAVMVSIILVIISILILIKLR
ncbi:PspC domain-containing protein [Candidatus Bathyarchaeota archaeon]|nr:PspC domain-containing protein [Candidatus Bathyarchaeota archaeon]MBS7613576.1 PspC domain-containing protein [Candidatus Bathyarchaeota archaeon]